MTGRFDPGRHRRRSIRLPKHDYRSRGAYFVTICTFRRACLFGQVVDGEMRTSDLGVIADEEWWRTVAVRAHVELRSGEFVVMPNHIHGIVHIVGPLGQADAERAATAVTGVHLEQPRSARATGSVHPSSLGAIVRSYKAIVSRRINAERGTPGAPVWQRSYFEHIIRDEGSLERIAAYIASNPRRWRQDVLPADGSERPPRTTRHRRARGAG